VCVPYGYKLDGKRIGMIQNQEILFRDWQWGECLDYLNNIIYYTDNILLVSGVLDSGKTTLKQETIRLLPRDFKVFSMFGEPRLGVVSFMQQVTSGFGFPCNNDLPPDWSVLQKEMFSQSDCNWVLLIDDAEKLSWDTLNALINLYTTAAAEGCKFSLILFADIILKESIHNSALKDFLEDKFQIIELQTLNIEQMKKFLTDHMQLNFDRKTLKKIYNASNGVIGKIKQLAISELNIKNTGENLMFKHLAENITNPPIIRIFVCGGLLLLAYALFSFTQKKDVSSLELALEQESHSPLQSKKVTNLDLHINDKILEQPTNKTISEHSNTVKDVNLLASVDNNVKYEQLYQQLHSDLKDNLQQLQLLQSEVNKLQEQVTILSSNDQKILIPQQPKIIVDSNTQKRPKNISSGLKSNKLQTNHEKQLLKIDKNNYVLQLMASKNEQSVKNLITKYPSMSGHMKYFSGKFKSQDDIWFIVVHGVYTNPEAALKDIRNLPVDLKKLKPIVRDYASVHKLINNNHH
jgi:type II secretory pathway predicted ATPase ExeA